MDSWKIINENGDKIFEGSDSELILFLPKIGSKIKLSINIVTKEIFVSKIDYDFDRAEQIRHTMNKTLLKKKRSSPFYIDDKDYKFCYKCKRSKSLGEFGFRKQSKDGLASNCRKCVAKKAKAKRKEKGK